MITKDEILQVADETGLTPAVVEKDHVLGWMLAGIHANSVLSKGWVFKGGTCLKKCYFETYRFSEDLDSTLRDEAHLDGAFLTTQFEAIAEWIYEACGIELPKDRLVFDVYDNPRGRKSCEGRIYYKSCFASGKRSLPKIKLDLTADEVIMLPPARRSVFHGYSDQPAAGIHIHCYDYPEVFGEKVRALGERGRPRDLYDVINLFRNDQLPAASIVRDVLAKKCTYKNIGLPGLTGLDGYRGDLERNWEPMLAHQLPSLPSLEVYWGALPEFFAWLEEKVTRAAPVLGAVSGQGALYRPTYGHLGLRTRSGSSLEIIRFSSGNRLCIDLDYTDNEGHRRSRVIEPYSLRRAANGNVLLYAVRADDGKIRAYKIDQINDASITDRVFTPRYQVELSLAGDMDTVPDLGGSGTSLGLPKAKRRTQRTPKFSNSGPTYIYRCPMCDRTFRRKTQNPNLKPHKTKDGWPCSGRVGYFEETVY